MTVLSEAYLYNPSTDAWTAVANGSLVARYDHAMVRVEDADGDDVVYIIGGKTSASAATGSIQVFTSTDGGTIASHVTESQPRFDTAAVAVDAGIFVVAGGAYFDGATPTPKSDCYAYDHQAAAVVPAGHLSIARMDLGLVRLSATRVLAVGGYGRNLTKETANRVLDECETWDLNTGRWSPAGKMKYARRKPLCFLFDSKVYVFGGTDSSGDPVEIGEIYDIRTGKWALAPAASTKDLHVDGAADADSVAGLSFGGLDSATPSDDAYLFLPGSDTISRASVNRQHVIASVPSSTVLEVTLAEGAALSATTGTATSMAAGAASQAGPYVWEPTSGPATTATETTLTTALAKGLQYASLSVADASDFADEPGWLAIGFGTEESVYPVRYLGKNSDTELRLDYGFRVPMAIPAGTAITFLAQKGPFVPEDPTAVGSFYLTASNAGRVEAERTVREALAAGFEHDITVSYPSDKGLGNSGYGVTGRKVSDKVAIWGSDDIDTDLETARNS